jgi:hypothetical protein
MMNRHLVPFLASTALSALVFASTGATAAGWWRTIDGSVCNPSSPDPRLGYFKRYDCPFVSDTVSGATSISGNAATSVYADYVVGENHVENLYISACGHAYNGSYACGTSVFYPSQNNGVYDVSVPLWKGTQSVWDYFGVSFQIGNDGGYLRPTGITATGNN